jgi:hypothetical protein
MPKGADWYKWIKDRLVESRMLLLLFTDNTAAWDWCLYEAGLFTQWDDDTRRIICLHTSRQPPAPLKHLQSVPALGEEILLFLRQLLVETELTGLESPLNAALASNSAELKRAADKIAKAMRRRQPAVYCSIRRRRSWLTGFGADCHRGQQLPRSQLNSL